MTFSANLHIRSQSQDAEDNKTFIIKQSFDLTQNDGYVLNLVRKDIIKNIEEQEIRDHMCYLIDQFEKLLYLRDIRNIYIVQVIKSMGEEEINLIHITNDQNPHANFDVWYDYHPDNLSVHNHDSIVTNYLNKIKSIFSKLY